MVEDEAREPTTGWRELFAERLRNEIAAREKLEAKHVSDLTALWRQIRKDEKRLTIVETKMSASKEGKGDAKWIVTSIIAILALIASAVSALS